MSCKLPACGQGSLPCRKALFYHGGAHRIFWHVGSQGERLEGQTHEPGHTCQEANNTTKRQTQESHNLGLAGGIPDIFESWNKIVHVTLCNISINSIEQDVAVDWPYWSVEASEEVDQSTSSVRVRQQSHVVVLYCVRTAYTLDPEGSTQTVC